MFSVSPHVLPEHFDQPAILGEIEDHWHFSVAVTDQLDQRRARRSGNGRLDRCGTRYQHHAYEQQIRDCDGHDKSGESTARPFEKTSPAFREDFQVIP